MGQVLITKRVPQTNWLTAILLEEGLIRKSAGIEHAASGKPMTWGPEEILNPPEDHPWYDKGPDGDWESDIPGMKAHHPVYGYDPVTGKLMFNKDGTPLGKHPIDAVAHDLQRMFDASNWPANAKAILQNSIEDYNDEHHEDNRVPNFNNTAWRRAVAIPYQGHDHQMGLNRLNYAKPTEEGGPRRFGTHHTNSGTVDAPGAHTGMWIDSGAFPINEHLRARLEQAEQKYGPLSRPDSKTGQLKPQDVSRLPYVKNHHVDLNLMTRDENYQPTVRRNSRHSQQTKYERGEDPLHAGNIEEAMEKEQNQHAIVSALSAAGHVPKSLLAPRLNRDDTVAAKLGASGKKGRRGHAIESFQSTMHPETGEPIIGGDSFENPEFGEHLTEEELNIFLSTQLSSLLFGAPGQGAANTMLNNVFEGLGIDESSPEYQAHHGRIMAAGNAFGGGKGRAKLAARIVAGARTAGDKWSGHDYIHDELTEGSGRKSGYKYSDEHAAIGHKIIGMLQERWGITPHDIESELHDRTPTREHDPSAHHDHPEQAPHWTPRVADETDMHIPGSDVAPAQREDWSKPWEENIRPPSRAPPPPAEIPSWGTRAPTAAEMAHRQQLGQFTASQIMQNPRFVGQFQGDDPEEARRRAMQAAQMTEAAHRPGQTFFGQPLSGGGPMDWVNQAYLKSRDDVVSAMDEIQKAMEEIQIERVLEDNEIMKHVPSDVSSPTTVGLFAKSMGLTSHDLYAINSTQGDWGKVAQKWNVNLKTVNVVKAAFRGC